MNNYKVTKLNNRIIVATEKIDYINSFSLGFWFNVGSRDETLKTNGISHLIEHMFFKGTKKRNARKISEEIESLGGYLNAFTSKEHTCYYGRGLKEHSENTFEVLADMIQNSRFDEKELRKESQVVVDELRDIEDSPEELIFDKFESIIFRGNTLNMPIIGTEENIQRFGRNDIFNYLNHKYKLTDFIITASGAVEHSAILNLADKYFAGSVYRNKKLNSRKPFHPKPSKNLFVYKDIQQAHMIIGGPTYGYKHKERAVINLISNLLGEGSSSRLFLNLREKHGIAYQVNTFMNSFWDVSSFGVYISTNEGSLKKAKSIIEKEFDKLKTKHVSDKELKRAKEYLKGHMQMSLESTSNRMMRMGSSMLYLKKIKTVEESIAEIDEVTSKDILEHSQKLLKPENLSTVIIASKNVLE